MVMKTVLKTIVMLLTFPCIKRQILPTVWTQIRADRTSALIWTQNVGHSDSILNKSADDSKKKA